MKKKRPVRIELVLMAVSLVMLAVFMFVVTFYYKTIMEVQAGRTDLQDHTYRYQYEMITDSRNSSFWQAVYDQARKEAAEADALVSFNQTGWNTRYDKLDYIDMFIAAGVDGIILEYNGEEGLSEKIDEAAAAGIPVVAVINDPNRSRRLSFVGVNDYQLGSAYGAEAARLCTEATESILILSNREQELEKNQMYAPIYTAVREACPDQHIKVREQNLNSRGQFEAEEAMRNIFQSTEGVPQILICLDEITTECAYQAMVDFNMVGEVDIVGFYTSGTILDAVHKGIVPSTVYMDADQVGSYSVEALTEYRESGRSNAYYTVDLHVMTKDDMPEQSTAESGEVQDEG